MFPSILIVDDEPSIRDSLGGLLSDEGFEILTAANGYEALKVMDKDSHIYNLHTLHPSENIKIDVILSYAFSGQICFQLIM